MVEGSLRFTMMSTSQAHDCLVPTPVRLAPLVPARLASLVRPHRDGGRLGGGQATDGKHRWDALLRLCLVCLVWLSMFRMIPYVLV